MSAANGPEVAVRSLLEMLSRLLQHRNVIVATFRLGVQNIRQEGQEAQLLRFTIRASRAVRFEDIRVGQLNDLQRRQFSKS